MHRDEVIRVVESLANGVDPSTGAGIPPGIFQNADTVRALFAASSLLKSDGATAASDRRATKTRFVAAGERWTDEEDARLGCEFDAAMTIGQIALQHGRTSGAITSRLVKLGRIDPANVKSRDRGARVISRAQPA